jgi:hypothetical protein
MQRSATAFALLFLISAIAPPGGRALAQAPGYAEITSPDSGEAVAGLISIEGSADHPAFLRYDLAFAYDPNPAGTWFPVGEPVSTRARQATLGLWDTSDIAPGVYQLRLRVFLDSGAVLEDVVSGLLIGLQAPASVATTAIATATPAIVRPTPTSAPIPAPAGAADEGDPVVTSLAIGGLMAAAFLIILAAYLPLRRSLAVWAGSLRMRRVLRQDSRRRRSDRGRS